jgi:hypothetical protein
MGVSLISKRLAVVADAHGLAPRGTECRSSQRSPPPESCLEGPCIDSETPTRGTLVGAHRASPYVVQLRITPVACTAATLGAASCREAGEFDTRVSRLDSRYIHSKVSLRRAVDACSGVVWRVSPRPSGNEVAARLQPTNLAVEGAEESLSILSDYTPTVRPPPKRS